MQLEAKLAELTRIRTSVSGAEITTFGLGGSVRLLVEPRTIGELLQTLRLLRGAKAPFRILGAGSNVLIPDEGISDLVIRMGGEFAEFRFLETELNSVEQATLLVKAPKLDPIPGESVRLFAFAGCSLMGLSRKTGALGLSGLEFAAGIPASIGGAVRMNAGAHGESMSAVIRSVLLLNGDGEIRLVSADSLNFSYRHSSIEDDMVVLGTEIELVRDAVEAVSERRNRCLDYRKRTQPLHLPSAGSVFRNPQMIREAEASVQSDAVQPAAAALLEAVGLKGLVRGGVQFSDLHANWLVKIGPEARSSDVRALISEAKAAVFARFDVQLSPELVLW